MKVETERKYYCIQPENLIKIAENLNFKKIYEEEESDEYFTDINSNFIKNRTCLRIRKNSNDNMEITYKGKSDSLSGLYCKLENSITVNMSEYDNYINLFTSLGYYSYVEVNKKRMVYELGDKKYKYSIMIDTLYEIGGFVEFEIISDQNNSTREELNKELHKFVSKFEDLKLKEVNEPYRDIVAKYICKKTIFNKNVLNICVNLDSELLRYEKEFYKKYKNEISKICSSNIKWGEYKKNDKISEKILNLIEEYINNLIFDSKELLVTIELLKQISYKKYFFTKVNVVFCNKFLTKLGIDSNNVLYIEANDTIVNVLNKNKVLAKNSIIINDSNFKKINSLLLVIINEL